MRYEKVQALQVIIGRLEFFPCFGVAVFYPLELLALMFVKNGPSTKMIICRKG
jgi:hypothetical protein